MAIFYLKYRDTRPVLRVRLLDPPDDAGVRAPHDLTGTTNWRLHIHLEDGTKLIRQMAVYGDEADGIVKYEWVSTDWATKSSIDADGSYEVGGLVVGPTLPLAPGEREHRMEYEILGPGGARLTFPNDGYDTLRILTDVGQGA